MSKLDDLAKLGQSIWLDFISRDLLNSGQLDDLVSQGLRGMTSNPSIFNQAISKAGAYDDDIKALVAKGKSVQQIYEALAFHDIQNACDALRPVYQRSDRLDGYVSLEVSPTLAHDTQGTINQVRSYFNAVDRPNLMIKIPATREGIPAIEAMLGEGINVNVTLMFSVKSIGRRFPGLYKRPGAPQGSRRRCVADGLRGLLLRQPHGFDDRSDARHSRRG